MHSLLQYFKNCTDYSFNTYNTSVGQVRLGVLGYRGSCALTCEGGFQFSRRASASVCPLRILLLSLAISAAVSPYYTTIPATIQRERGAPPHRRRTDTYKHRHIDNHA
jgi:hypothetical protein